MYFEWTIAPSNQVSVHVSESSDEEELEEEESGGGGGKTSACLYDKQENKIMKA